ncbi:xanthine dehydrogenase family protein subunit M [Candidatus Sumerlaeota bacterium]|nr:xanthine dehydrogenase family protein subunit M [Candidatus Sumerlaeota bacterium]
MAISRYSRPTSVAQACALLSDAPGRTALLTGGTDMAVSLRSGRDVDLMVDLKRIPELHTLGWSDEGELTIGACMTLREICESTPIRERFPALTEAAEVVGSYQIRCRATITGNLCNASPCADTIPPLLALGARIRITDPSGEREEPLDGFITHVKKTRLKPSEVVTAVIVPPPPPGSRNAFMRIQRLRGHDLALVNAAATFNPKTRAFTLAVGSVAPTPLLIPDLDDACPSGATPDEVGERLAERTLPHISPIDDVRASAEYRRDMTALLCRRLARRLMGNP